MPTNDGFDRDYPLPAFLVDQFEPQGIAKARDRAVTSSRVLKASILMAAAVAIGVTALSIGNPVALLTEVTASLIDNSGLKSADPSTPTIQVTADEAQPLPSTAKDAPIRNDIAAAEPVRQDQTEKTEPPSTEKAEPTPDALFRQFQAWADEKDAQARVEPAQPVQDAPAQASQSAPAEVAENARRPVRLMQKRRHVQPVGNARAEMRAQNYRKRVRQDQDARTQLPPTQDPRAQDPRAQYQYMQNAQPAQQPSFLQTFGLRN